MPNIDPNIGLITLPLPFAASIIPKDLARFFPLHKSPHMAIATGAVPAAPIPSLIHIPCSI
ncbi:hypothetical protein M1N11_01530 [Peptococcaceae bacterium]|nr:hypothetical protein [Peptococcaceae bacterium]